MKQVSVAQASRSLGESAAELDDEIVVVTKGTRPVAALVPLKNVDKESLALSTHPGFVKLVRRARAEIAAGKKLSLKQLRRTLVAKRADRRAR